MTHLHSTIIRSLIISSIVISSMVAHAGPPKIQCPDSPKNGVRNLTYKIIWAIPAETEDYLIGYTGDAAYDQSGNLCIVDSQQKNLAIFDSKGNWLRTIGREGEGPGELRDARKVFFNGDQYGLFQAFPAAIIWLNADGTPAEKTHFGGDVINETTFVSSAHAMQVGAHIYAWIEKTRFSESETESEIWITEVGADGHLGKVMYTPPEEQSAREEGGINEGKVYDIWMHRWTSDGRGGVWVAPDRDHYVLQHWNSGGGLALEVSRKYKPVTRNKAGVERIEIWFQRRGWNLDQIRVGKTSPVVKSLRMSEAGNVWVELELGGEDPDSDLVAVYDVISPTGEYLEQLQFHSSMALDSRIMLDDMTVVIMTTDPDDEEPVITLQKAAGIAIVK